MKWFEFTQDNGDGSYSKCRFKTKEEAEKTLVFLEKNIDDWIGDGDGVTEVDTDSSYFWDTFEDTKANFDES